MQKLTWATAPAVFLLFFGVYSFRLGIQPTLMHDDFEYSYPSFDLAERGRFGSPLLGPALNIENRTYNLIVYYYATVHALLIRVFGDGPGSVPLANTFHFALLAAVGALFLARRRAFLGALVFLYALASDQRMVDASRHGRPEMTAGFCLLVAVLALWLWRGEGRRRGSVLFGLSAALVAGMLSHSALVFLALALALVFAAAVAREAGPRDLVAGLVPSLAIPLLYGYFLLTDDVANLLGQVAPNQGDVALGAMLNHVLAGDWRTLARLSAEFVHAHAGPPWLWLGALASLALPALAPHRLARAARFFALVYCVLVLAHFLCLKPFVLSYRALYQATLYMALALLVEVLTDRIGAWCGRPVCARALRVGLCAVGVLLCARQMDRFRSQLLGQPLPFARLQGALTYALLESGARPGDRVFVPSPFGFHLRRSFDVIAHPAPKYYRGRWSPEFRNGLREIWGAPTLTSVSAESLCYGMGLAFIRPAWIVAWDFDYSTMQPFYQFLKKYPDLPGLRLDRGARAELPAPYGGSVRVYQLSLSQAVTALDVTPRTALSPCP